MSLRRRVADLEARVEALEAEPDDVPEWKPRKYHDHSGDPVDGQSLWREVVAEYAHGWTDDTEEWQRWGYL